MSNMTPFLRKIIYLILIVVLLVPLSMVSRPATRKADGEFKDEGGILSQLRDENNLSQAKMSEIDPASETMKLASLGLRGVAVNMLWMQAIDHKKKENYDKLASTLLALTKIQPNFVKVWEYQAHNLAYNVSMEFDDYEYRYSWVKKGLEFLKSGIPYNKRDHRVPDSLGFFVGNKFGKSDEKLSYRRLFRKDNEFHEAMSDKIDPESYVERQYGPDSWLMAYQWYEYSRRMVEEESCPQRRSDMLFYMYGPAQIREEAMSLQSENRTGEVIQDIWRRAADVWVNYGKKEITNTLGVTYQLEGMEKDREKVRGLREKLDALVRPGLREELLDDAMAQAGFQDEDKLVMKMSASEMTDEQFLRRRMLENALEDMTQGIDEDIAQEVEDIADLVDAKKLSAQILKIKNQIVTNTKDSSTVNYSYWRVRTEAESSDLLVRARQAIYDADQMYSQSIYDDEYDFDFETKKRSVTKRGAITLYLQAFSLWQEVFDKYDSELQTGVAGDQVVDFIRKFKKMLQLTNREWPNQFPLQAFIDYRARTGKQDDLLTSEMLEEIRSGRFDPDEQMAGSDVKPMTDEDLEKSIQKDVNIKMLPTDPKSIEDAQKQIQKALEKGVINQRNQEIKKKKKD
ncbi:MAG: hypothetical protein AAF939_03040 [Planctomycetota bacterium]